MSAHEFSEWIAYSALEPFGEIHADLRAGVLASVIANVNRDAEKQREPFQPGDFFPTLPKAKKRRAKWEEILAKMKAIGQGKHR